MQSKGICGTYTMFFNTVNRRNLGMDGIRQPWRHDHVISRLISTRNSARFLKKNYRVCTVFEYLSEKPEGNIAVVRHDVDRKIKNSLHMAEREHALGIRSSYYFRYPFTFRPDIITKIRILAMRSGITMKS